MSIYNKLTEYQIFHTIRGVDSNNENSNLISLLKKIQLFRELKGQEYETLNLIEEAMSLAKKDDKEEVIASMYWESSLVWQHMLMQDQIKPLEQQDKKLQRKALENMELNAVAAHGLIISANLHSWLSKSHRFLGRIASYKNDWDQARFHYEEAIRTIETHPEFAENPAVLFEVEGFLASCLIMLGKQEEGLKLAKDVYAKYDETEQGKYLKVNNYYTWAVWKSGVPIFAIQALLASRKEFDKNMAIEWLKDADNFLTMDFHEEAVGDKNFELRKDDINALLIQLQS